MKPPVLSKRDFVRRYQAGEFGNMSPTWPDLSAYLASGYAGLVHVRNRVAGGLTWYNIPTSEVADCWKKASDLLNGSHQLYISAMCPTHRTLFQGEVVPTYRHLDLCYTTVAKPMRTALAIAAKQVHGLVAESLLRYYLCPNSYDWLQQLFINYPDHVIEFSSFDTYWGTVPRCNTVFWEVRCY